MRLTILRHAPCVPDGRMVGRRDVAANCGNLAALARQRGRIGAPTQVIASPALRCRQTAEALSLVPDRLEPSLWEQDFGRWEDLPPDRIPDLGQLPPDRLARHRPDGGESFDDMAARVIPVLQSLDRDSLLIAHAGTVRAALSMVVGAVALSFAVAPLSMTVLNRIGDQWSVEAVNIGSDS
ncbi:histidine phosphatase family protein [Paracoccus beibuensis]|uniref:histidine phosphatase family protein n=1 Tax=Paracoccus beibuensis TaxID=547602 RepID=UPI00223EF0C8|nr:histidine phosphatase family protein [Paracoccus beibuensis]